MTISTALSPLKFAWSAIPLFLALQSAVPIARADDWIEAERVPLGALAASDFSRLAGNRAYINDALGQAILRIPASQAADVHFDFEFNVPHVFGIYDPDNATGSISVMRLLKLPAGDVVAVQRRFTPEEGDRFSAYYSMNPFQEFSGGDGAFVHITPDGFRTAIGLVMRHYGAAQAYIAMASTRTDVTQSQSGNRLRRRITTTLNAYTKPIWYLVVPAGTAAGDASGYRLPNGRTVSAGMSFIPQGPGTNMPAYEYLSYQHSETKSYWSGFATLLFTGLVGGIAGGPALSAALVTTQFTWNMYQGGEWYLNDAVNQPFLSGTSDINPGASTGDWDYRAATYALARSDPLNTPGAFGEGLNGNRLRATDATTGSLLQRDLAAPTADLRSNLSINLAQ